MIYKFNLIDLWYHHLGDKEYKDYVKMINTSDEVSFTELINRTFLGKVVDFICIGSFKDKDSSILRDYQCYTGKHKGTVTDIKIEYAEAYRKVAKTEFAMLTEPTVYLKLDTMKTRFHRVVDQQPMFIYDPSIELERMIKDIRTAVSTKRFDL